MQEFCYHQKIFISISFLWYSKFSHFSGFWQHLQLADQLLVWMRFLHFQVLPSDIVFFWNGPQTDKPNAGKHDYFYYWTSTYWSAVAVWWRSKVSHVFVFEKSPNWNFEGCCSVCGNNKSSCNVLLRRSTYELFHCIASFVSYRGWKFKLNIMRTIWFSNGAVCINAIWFSLGVRENGGGWGFFNYIFTIFMLIFSCSYFFCYSFQLILKCSIFFI